MKLFFFFLGIGKATALRLAQEGCHVIATDIDKEALKSLENLDDIETKVLDVTDKEAIEKLASEVEKLDILFNCAGYTNFQTFLQTFFLLALNHSSVIFACLFLSFQICPSRQYFRVQ